MPSCIGPRSSGGSGLDWNEPPQRRRFGVQHPRPEHGHESGLCGLCRRVDRRRARNRDPRLRGPSKYHTAPGLRPAGRDPPREAQPASVRGTLADAGRTRGGPDARGASRSSRLPAVIRPGKAGSRSWGRTVSLHDLMFRSAPFSPATTPSDGYRSMIQRFHGWLRPGIWAWVIAIGFILGGRAALAAGDSRDWMKWVPPHYELYGDGREFEAKRLLRQLETFRYVVSRFLGLTNVQRRPALGFFFDDD